MRPVMTEIRVLMAAIAAGLAVITPLSARVGYRRTRECVPDALRKWIRYAVAQECKALVILVLGGQTLLLAPPVSLVHWAVGILALAVIFLAAPRGIPLALYPTRRFCRTVCQYYERHAAHDTG